MSTQGEINEFLNLLFGELNERRFAQVIKVIDLLISYALIDYFLKQLLSIRPTPN